MRYLILFCLFLPACIPMQNDADNAMRHIDSEVCLHGVTYYRFASYENYYGYTPKFLPNGRVAVCVQ